MNFWVYVQAIADEPPPEEIGITLAACHEVLREFGGELPHLGILHESLALCDRVQRDGLFHENVLGLLRYHLQRSVALLEQAPSQALHGDAHQGNLLLTEHGVVWSDWEDAFTGPVEWDVASIIWNTKLIEGDVATVERLITGYESSGLRVDRDCLQQCLVARAAVMTAWYPVLYPDMGEERRAKLDMRLRFLERSRG